MQFLSWSTAGFVVLLSALGLCSTAMCEEKQPDTDGFVEIFDGKTLKGWHAMPKDSASDWTVDDGIIVGRGSVDRQSFLVWENEKLTDFELELSYRLPGKGNTGVELRLVPDKTGKRVFEAYHADLGHIGIGPHILGAWDFHFGTRKEHPCNRGTRLVIDENEKAHSSKIPGAVTLTDIRDKQWNDIRVVARGNHFQYFINGKPAAEFTDNAKKGQLKQGGIGLQIHDKGMRVEFKNVRLKRLAPAQSENAKTKPDMKRDRYLVLDSRIIESTDNVELTVGVVQKDENNPLFKEDKPWEPRFDNPYSSVIYDEEEKIYKCWYSIFVKSDYEGTPSDKRAWLDWHEGRRTFGLCYATSKDGLKWEKPELGLIEYNGSKKNNIVMYGYHGTTVIKDTRETDPKRRYKAIHPFNNRTLVWFSHDGLNWERQELPGLCRGDTNQGVWWDEDLKKYVIITRAWGGAATTGRYGRQGHRQKVRSESADFIHWSKPELVIEGLDLRMQIHDMPAVPHAGVYLGMVGLFDIEASKQWCELAWSPDSIKWYRIQPGKPLIPNGPVMGDYDWGCIFTSKPIIRKDGILLYYGANDGRFMAWRNGFFCLARLRADGFAGYEQMAGGSNKTGSLTTKPVSVVADSLCISADVAASGFVKVTLLDEDDKTLAEGELVAKTVTDAEIQWKDGFSLKKLKGAEVKLKFELRESKLFSFSFH